MDPTVRTHPAKAEAFACKLSSAEFAKHKQIVLAALKTQVVESKETESGIGFRFDGSDGMIDQLTEFIKTERQCCDFFRFSLCIAKDSDFVWLELSGPEGSKSFIRSELGL